MVWLCRAGLEGLEGLEGWVSGQGTGVALGVIGGEMWVFGKGGGGCKRGGSRGG